MQYDFSSERRFVREYSIADLEDSRNNHFHGMEGDSWDEFVGSIREYGIISPLIIREKAGSRGKYEILAGHNRRRGAAEAGLTTVPCISVQADDVDASVLIGITNRQREEVSDLEWGWTYRTTLEALKYSAAMDRRRGERSIDIVARKYGVNRKTVQRKIRLTYLVPQLYELGKKLRFSQKMLIDLSYLPPVAQINVVQAVVIEDLPLTDSLAAHLRSCSGHRDLTINEILEICRSFGSCNNKADGDAPRPRRYEIPDSLFPGSLAEDLRTDYVCAALSYVSRHEIDLALG